MSQPFSLATAMADAQRRLALLSAADGAPPVAPRVHFPSVEAPETARVVGGAGEFPVGGGGPPPIAAGFAVFEMLPEIKSQLCLGSVARGDKFCTLGRDTCVFGSHTKKVEVQENCLYIAGAKNSAFSRHFLELSKLSTRQRLEFLSEHHTVEEWVLLFDTIDNCKEVLEEVEMAGVKKKRAARYESLILPEEGLGQPLVPLEEGDGDFLDADDQMTKVISQWDRLLEKVDKIAANTSELHHQVGDDVDALEAHLLLVESRVGNDPGIGEESFASVWDGIAFVNDGVSQLQKSKAAQDDVTALEKQVHEVKDSMAIGFGDGRDAIRQLQASVAEGEKARSDILQFLQLISEEQRALSALCSATRTANGDGVNAAELRDIRSRMDALEASQRQNNAGISTGINMTAEIAQLQAKIKLLEARVSVTPIVFGGELFSSQQDVAAFVTKFMPSNVYYLFHDAVTLLESISDAFVPRAEVLAELYQGQKVGLEEAESRMVASFKITLPTVFAKSLQGTVKASGHLPGIADYDAWNSHDNMSGAKFYIQRGIDDQKVAIKHDIEAVLEEVTFSRAKSLALDMQNSSHAFVSELCAWTDSFYQELLRTSDSTPAEAWELTSSCIKRIFEELRKPRAGATYASAIKDPVLKAAQYLWALLQAHAVMKSFIDARFRNHPAIFPVIVLHIFRTRVTKAAYDKQKAILQKLEARCNQIDSLQTRLAKLEKKG